MISKVLTGLILCLTIVGISFAQTTPTAMWPLDGNANDVSGSNMHGTVSGAIPTTDRKGNPGAAFLFDGNNDYISLPGTQENLAFVQNTGIFTIAAFIKISNLNARSCILGTAITSVDKGFLFWFENHGGITRQLGFARYSGVAGVFDAAYGHTGTIKDNDWHHVAVVGDGSTLKFYVDGVQDGPTAIMSRPSTGQSTWPGVIGSTRDAGGSPTLLFNGGIDDLQIYKRGLSQDEILSLMNSGEQKPALVKGKIFSDKNTNGVYDAGDEPVSDLMIKAEPGAAYAISDNNGDYFLYLENGSYTLEQVIPNYKGKFIKQTSPVAGYDVNVTSATTEYNGFNFGNEVKVIPVLSVDVNSTRFRRCFTNTTQVLYCNEGHADASNVQVVLEYPEYIVPIKSSIPWTKNGTKYTFTIGALEAKTCRSLTLTDSVICGNESIRGLTQCIKASITPKNNVANTHPDWDKSDIALTAECRDNGFVRVTFNNKGTGAMTDSAAFNIFLDQARVYSGKYKLNAAESISLNLLANGKPLHLEASLTPYHPEKVKVSVSIQGCNTDGGAVVKGGFEAQFSQNDESESDESTCLPILDSYDPNDKLVMPAGITPGNNVVEDALLEYTIRFQNTGTDVAYNIVVEDPLSQHLDISTLKVGVSSHPVQWEVKNTGQSTIVWRFKNIMLPDSTTNEKASHGFVKFQIRPKPGAGKGTVIRNHASIYFDYNSPIITNEVSNTLGLPEIMPGEKITVQNCNTRLDLATEQDVVIVLCGEESYQLSRTAPLTGRGMWKVIQGDATLTDPFSNQTEASKLSIGENVFSWEVTYCDQKVSSLITVVREEPLEKPAVATTVNVCEGEPASSITATGEGIEWYSDPALSKLLARGTSYKPSGEHSEMLYVVQRNNACVSQPSVVSVAVHVRPMSPAVDVMQEACVDIETPVLTALGSNIRWYADADKQELLAEGADYQPTEKSGRKYYVTQSNEYCESDAMAVTFMVKQFEPAKARIANVVTPNEDDGHNRYYYVQDFESKECLGEFVSIKIFNRWGAEVFESKKSDFKWDPAREPAGVYYYKMQYQLQPFFGYIQVVK